MMNAQQVRTRYSVVLGLSVLVGFAVLMVGINLMPVKYSQKLLLEDPGFSKGIHETLLELEEKIQNGEFKLVDNVPSHVQSGSYSATIIKMAEEKKIIPHTKYRIEIRFRFPYTIMSRSTKLETILVDVSPEQNHDFADLFWSLH